MFNKEFDDWYDEQAKKIIGGLMKYFRTKYIDTLGKFRIEQMLDSPSDEDGFKFITMSAEELNTIKPELFLNYDDFKKDIKKCLQSVKS